MFITLQCLKSEILCNISDEIKGEKYFHIEDFKSVKKYTESINNFNHDTNESCNQTITALL